MFLKNMYEVSVPEDTAPWKEILQISAQDADINSRIIYSIHSSLNPDSLKHFQLDPKSGVLVLTTELDYEAIATHNLLVMVKLFLSHNMLKLSLQSRFFQVLLDDN